MAESGHFRWMDGRIAVVVAVRTVLEAPFTCGCLQRDLVPSRYLTTTGDTSYGVVHKTISTTGDTGHGVLRKINVFPTQSTIQTTIQIARRSARRC